MKLKLDNRAKDSIVKLVTLLIVIVVLTVVLSLIWDHVAGATVTAETELISGMVMEITDDEASEIVADDEDADDFELEKDQLMTEDGTDLAIEDDSLLGGESAEITALDESLIVDDSSGFFIEVGDALGTFMDSVSDALLGDEDDDFPGVPSDVPPDALSWPDDEALIESESETETAVEAEPEVLMELKAIDFSDYPYDESWAVALAQLAWAEGRGLSMREQSLVMWTVLNRLDVCYDGRSDFWSILTAPYQFAYYSNSPYEEYEYRIAVDVLQRWAAEKDGVEDSGRTLPKGYLYYYGDGSHNYFGMNGFSNELWFGLGDPYEDWTY